jgi:uncharacterized membrane protein YraQ (UPF0718 family)
LPNRITPNAVVPQYEALVSRGVSATAAMAFLLAAPALGLDALLLSLPLLGLELTVARLLGAVAVAMLVAMVVGRRVEPDGSASEDSIEATSRTLGERLRAGMRYALIDLFDHTMPWVVAGVLVATVAQPILAHIGWASIQPLLQVPLLAILAIPLYVGASGAMPVALIAIHQGLSPGAAIAFLLAGAATNRSTFELLTRLHGRSIAMLTGITVVGVSIAAGWLIDGFGLYELPVWHSHHHGPVTPLVWFSLLALGLLGLGSLFRQGPRRALHQVTTPIHTD